ncbi:hypothetical protein Dtox_1403 [Desulfofarcimen acetoxidans DSM 771]|uniref:Uncharacterized protein n=2 Tax=Desulfofarcimen acetoxidans TaxID=58138 RepID=C8W6I9_DESAS|nr:hypothetical protein Dtox_1403 [Desulfofarcimen acetoxidans DSM 771]
MEVRDSCSIRPKKLKRVVIKEELTALTGDIVKAIILNQFIYWSERVQDFDKFISEERSRAEQAGTEINIEYTKGWIYKSAEELSEETMLKMSASSMRKHLKELIDKGWLLERTNPFHKWDRTKQYRVDLLKIQNDLWDLGYVLQDYKIPFFKTETPFSKSENAFSKIENGVSNLENPNSETKNQTAKNRKAIPEITTEITNKEKISIYPAETFTDGLTDEENLKPPNSQIDYRVDTELPLHFSNTEELLAELVNRTGASKEQVCRAVQRTKEFEAQGKVKKSFMGLLFSVIETIKTEDTAKGLTSEIKEGNSAAASEKQKRLLESLYMN